MSIGDRTVFAGGRYRVERRFGGGTQADTFEAFDARLAASVVVKRFVIRGAATWKEVELAEREAHVLASLQHPNLPRYIDHFEEDGALFLVMELVPGEDLAAIVKREGSLSRARAIRFLEDAADVLDYLHQLLPPVIHRDIKPRNVILRPDGSFALVDFGSVRHGMQASAGSTVVGTFGYMSPEQFQGRAMPVSDVYSVGATALALVTGQEPETLPHVGLRIDVAAALKGMHDLALVKVLDALLEPDPARRPSRIRPLLTSLAQPMPMTVETPPLAPSNASDLALELRHREPRRIASFRWLGRGIEIGALISILAVVARWSEPVSWSALVATVFFAAIALVWLDSRIQRRLIWKSRRQPGDPAVTRGKSVLTDPTDNGWHARPRGRRIPADHPRRRERGRHRLR